MTTYPPSSQAGLATFDVVVSNTSTPTFVRYCPECRTHPLVRWRAGDVPHGYCTNPDCTYTLEDW